ncbi:MAG TPA: serine/threonine-protein kinase [Stellaceae bacterium]|jgi:serine/threonine-protein kinase|nr:serine/threonine-protein kinase [Stellaceae bacterium]
MDEAPASIGRYRIEFVIGRGAMGVIYRAYDPDIDRRVAIKLVRADLLSGQARDDYVLRFRREAQAAGRCVHSNIVTVYDFALHDGNPFIAMEFVDGRNLAELRAGGRLLAAEAIAIAVQVLDGLAAAHRMGVIHRDIKPANILLVNDRLVKVTDFGISRIDTSDLTVDGTMIGTPSYMSPEQCRGLAVDARSDIFSLGVVLYELLCAQRPFAGANATEVMQRLLNDEPAAIETVDPTVDPALRAIVNRALAKSTDARYGSAADMAVALRALDLSAATDATQDRTVVISRSRGDAPPAVVQSADPAASAGAGDPSMTFDAGVLATIERKLAGYVGPIARVALKGALRSGATIEELCNTLAANIAAPGDRERFRTEALAELQRAAGTHGGYQSGATPVSIPAAELERVEKELTRYLGPIARVLVRRDAVKAGSAVELGRLVSRHIDRDDERSDFVRRLES